MAKGDRIRNKPFLHNQRIEERDGAVGGNMRKLVRLLKSLKYDADVKPDITSYDIVSIVYNMPDNLLDIATDAEPLLAQNCSLYMDALEENDRLRTVIMVPNGMRKVFCAEGASLTGLKGLNGELKQLLWEIENDLKRSFRKLSEARIRY